MFTFSEPSDREITKYISSQAKLPFSYAEVGATNSGMAASTSEVGAGNAIGPAGYTLDHNRVQLGHGGEIYRRAVAALKQWRQFELGWVTLVPHGVKVETGAVVAVKARAAATATPKMRVLDSIGDDGPKLVEMPAEGELSLRLSRPELKIGAGSLLLSAMVPSPGSATTRGQSESGKGRRKKAAVQLKCRRVGDGSDDRHL